MANIENSMRPLEEMADVLAARYTPKDDAAKRKEKAQRQKARKEAREGFDAAFDAAIKDRGQAVLPQTLTDFNRGRVTTITPPVEVTSGEQTFQFWAVNITTQFAKEMIYSGKTDYKYIYAGPKGEARPEKVFSLERDTTRINTIDGLKYSYFTRQHGLGGVSTATHDEVINASEIAHSINVGLRAEKIR